MHLEAKYWPHAPLHQLSESGTYFVTGATYHKLHHFAGSKRLRYMHGGLLKYASKFNWRLEAWAVFSNHYHFVAHSPAAEGSAESLREMLSLFHERSAKWLNQLEATPGRQVWHNFWDTQLTFTRAYMARLNYVHQNAVHHGLVKVAHQYPWCSANWFEQIATTAKVRTIYSMKIDKVNVLDDFEVSSDW